MKPYKQAKIPKGYVEVRMRGSANEEGSLSFKRLVRKEHAGQIMAFIGQFQQPAKVKKVLAPHLK